MQEAAGVGPYKAYHIGFMAPQHITKVPIIFNTTPTGKTTAAKTKIMLVRTMKRRRVANAVITWAVSAPHHLGRRPGVTKGLARDGCTYRSARQGHLATVTEFSVEPYT